MCFVDTPGLGLVFTGNTATTQAFIPPCDAALVVVGADPPIGGEELTLVESIGTQVQDLILVINKADRTDRDPGACSRGQVHARDAGEAIAPYDGRSLRS